MSLSADEVRRVAHLARLGIDDSEVAATAEQLGRILQLVEQMSAVDTAGIAPLAHPLETSQRLRPDEVTEVVQREAVQGLSGATENGLYLVPRVIG
ncbi:MAG: Asp-tRNA(Asn)/Glu-tRNA(Gln) amidotransferase subunit GatC [Gammaproteobacteria bacterium]|nr:Asp-tRNA(Asn)/Glu-tRNA(Gln) amidotransferase subunit GatC [Gammaproteobacteria bacterium]